MASSMQRPKEPAKASPHRLSWRGMGMDSSGDLHDYVCRVFPCELPSLFLESPKDMDVTHAQFHFGKEARGRQTDTRSAPSIT